MKPEYLKSTNKSKGEARVKTSIRAHLYWFSGFPYLNGGNVYWCCPGIPETDKQKITLTSKMISKAHRIINELRRDFPMALPRVVGDAKEWEERCKNYLEYTKSIISEPSGYPIEPLFDKELSFKTKLKKNFDEKVINSDLGTAMSWMHYVNRDDLVKSMTFISNYRSYILSVNHLDIVQLSKLCHIYVLDSGKSSGFLKLHLNPRGISTATKEGRAYINPLIQYRYNPKKKKNFRFPKKPQDNTSKRISKSVSWMLELNSNQRKRALALFDSIEIDSLVNIYQSWWKDVDQLTEKISKLISYPNVNKVSTLSELQSSLESLLTQFPESLEVSDIFSAVNNFSENETLNKALCRFFQQCSKYDPASSLKTMFLILFNKCLSESDKNVKYITEYIRAFSIYIRNCSSSIGLAPWGKVPGSYWSSCESDIFDNLKMSELTQFFEVLLLINQQLDKEISKDWIDGISMIVAAGYTKNDASNLAISLIKKEKIDNLSQIVLNIAFEQNMSYEKTIKLVDIWNKLDEEYTDDDTLEVIYKTFSSINGFELFNNLIFAENISVLRHCSNQIRVIKKIESSGKIPIFTSITEDNREGAVNDWIEVFPEEYHGNLAALNNISTSAQKISGKIFLANWWPKSYIKIELKKLSEQLEIANATNRVNIESRISNLKNRLKSHSPASETVQEKIQNRLVERIKKEQFNNWKSRLEKVFRQSWTAFLGIEQDALPKWLLDEKLIQCLLPIADFKVRSKELAKYVIKQRCLSEKGLFVKHPKNEAFLRQLSEGGFSTQVWLEGIGQKSYKAKSSKDIMIDVVSDPLEMINMGGHFKTCLSPGSFNYFSVFANIADINKRVIYGKSSDGKVIGRVLVGLMPSGGVKVFNIYFHNAEDEFKPRVMDYIKSWVEFAGFTLTDHGDIPKLVSSEWYDDGAISVDNTIKCLKKGSQFREQLECIAPHLLESELVKELSPLPINELTFPLIVVLPEIKKRPELVPVLVTIARKIPRLCESEKIKLFQLAHESQAGEQCYQAFRQDLLNNLLRSIREDRWIDTDLAYSIATYNPSDSLRAVKKFGNCWKGNWQGNLYSATAKVTVKSLKMLGRELQAMELAKQYKITA